MNRRIERIGNIIRVIAIIVALISLGFNYWQFKEKSQLEETSEAIILHQAGEIADANRKIREYEAQLAYKQAQVDSLLKEANDHSLFRDSLMYEVSHLQFIIDKLKEQIDESITIPDFSDDEHFQLFLEWTDLERYSP